MKKLLIGLLAFGSISAFASPINLLGCQSENKYVHARVLDGGILDVTVTTGSYDYGTESSMNYSAELSEDEKMMIDSGSWTISLSDYRRNFITLSIDNNSEGKLFGDGYPDFLKCQRLTDSEVFGY